MNKMAATLNTFSDISFFCRSRLVSNTLYSAQIHYTALATGLFQRGLRHVLSSVTRALELPLRIPLVAWTYVSVFLIYVACLDKRPCDGANLLSKESFRMTTNAIPKPVKREDFVPNSTALPGKNIDLLQDFLNTMTCSLHYQSLSHLLRPN